MKKIFSLLLLSILITNCSSDSSSNSNASTSSGTKIKRIEELQNGFIIKSTDYQYNSLGNITKMVVNDRTNIYETTFQYNSNNQMITWKLKEYRVSNPSSKKEQTNTLEYSNGKITNVCIDRVDNTFSGYTFYEADRILFSYNSGIYPTSIQHYYPQSSTAPEYTCADVTYVSEEELFEYVNGNTSRYTIEDSGFSSSYNILEYDTKNNPLAMIQPAAFKNIIGRSSVNNMTKAKVYNSSDDTLQGTSVFENSYNANNFLIKAIERYYPAGNPNPTVTTIMNYYYY